MIGKKLLAIAVSASLVMASNPSIALAAPLDLQMAGSEGNAIAQVDTQAGKTLKERGVKFDLKDGKTVNTVCYLKGAGNLSYKAKLSGLKTTEDKTSGYKQSKFNITFKLKKGLTNSQVKKTSAAYKKVKAKYRENAPSVIWSFMSGNMRIHFVDYRTGYNVHAVNSMKNVADVTVKETLLQQKRMEYGSGESSFSIPKTLKVGVIVTIPSSYKNLCVGVGGDTTTSVGLTAVDETFKWEDSTKYRYHQTSWFKKGKAYNHFMRIE